MAKKAARATARSVQIEHCATAEDLHAFLTETCGFKLLAGFFPVTGDGEHVYSVNDTGDTIDASIVDDASSSFLNDQIKKLSTATGTAQYQLIVQSDFQKVAIQRAKAPASWGRKERCRVVYSAASRKEDTKKSILAKINGLRYQTGDDQDTFNTFFDVREIVDRFYAEYEKVRGELAASITFPVEVSKEDRGEYATAVMNRLVFTYFLQTPDPATKRSVIPQMFLQDLYGKHARTKKSYFHCLCRLWFDFFNDDRPRVAADGIFEQIPYLNGGLFAYREGIEVDGTRVLYHDIGIPDETWEKVFELLDGYNWTVVENDEDDDELSVTPSILGHIYEKACNQKETGSYYTPDHVTNYIARECIGKLAADRVNAQFKATRESFIDVLKKESLSPGEIEQVKWFHKNVLLPITVCDNACGSGAFLLAAEKILVDLHQACDKWIGGPGMTLHAIKKHVVTRNLFGVDLQPGSVEIAKLRLWLSMIPAMHSSENELQCPEQSGVDRSVTIRKPVSITMPRASGGGSVEPLPNIDYNILPGNSLIGFVKLPGNWGKSLLSNPDKLKRVLAEYRVLKDAFRSATASADREDLKEKIDAIRKAVRAELDALLKEDLAITAGQVAALRPFHWGFECEEVFSRGGFDIIIGNPPYVRQETLGEFKAILEKNYKVYTGITDLYCYFFERSFQTIKKDGYLGYISSNKWIRTKYGENTRTMLHQKRVDRIIDFFELPVFRGVGTEPAILVACNKNEKEGIINFTPVLDKNFTDIESIVQKLIIEIDKDTLDDEPGWAFPRDPLMATILKKLKAGSIELQKYLEKHANNAKINMGLRSGKNTVFTISKNKYDELVEEDNKSKGIIKPFIMSENVLKYFIHYKSKRIILTKLGINIDDYPSVKRYLEEHKKELEERDSGNKGNKWFEYRICAYYDDFELDEKIVYTRILKDHVFAIDNKRNYMVDGEYFITTGDRYLVSFLNSSLFVIYKVNTFVSFGDAAARGRCKLDYNKMLKVPIKPINDEQRAFFVEKVNDVMARKESFYTDIATFFDSIGIENVPKRMDEFWKMKDATFIKEVEKITGTEVDDGKSLMERKMDFKDRMDGIVAIETEIDDKISDIYRLDDKEKAFLKKFIKGRT